METKTSVGLSNDGRGYTCGQDAARFALDRMGGGPVSLALLFTSHPNPGQVLKGVNNTLGDVPLVGVTSAGEYTEDGYVEQGAGIMLIRSADIHFHPIMQQRRWFGRGNLLGKLRGLSSDGLGSAFNHRALFIFPDDQSSNLDSIVDRAMTETAMLYDILGGPSPLVHDPPPRPPAIFNANRVLKSGLSGAEILSQNPFGLALANGWKPVSDPYRVTRTSERKVVTIDGRPAREVYEDFMMEQDLPIERLSELVIRYPIGLCDTSVCKVSIVMGFDKQGALLVTSPPPVDSLIHILSTQPDAMITAAERALDQAMGSLHNQDPSGVLFIDCMSTAMVLDSDYPRQQAAVRQRLGADVPFLGYRSHGVLARLAGQTTGHYECSVAACVLPG